MKAVEIRQLDFEEDPPANIWQAVSRCLQHFGDDGATIEELVGMFQKNTVGWQPQSVSPACSNLVSLGCAKETKSYGVRRFHHLKTFTEAEHQVMKERQSTRRRELAEEKYQERKNAELQRPAAPVLGRDAPVAVQAGKMMVAYGTNQTFVGSPREARELFEALRGIFG